MKVGDVLSVERAVDGPDGNSGTVVSRNGAGGGGEGVESDALVDKVNDHVLDALTVDKESARVECVGGVANDEVPSPLLGPANDDEVGITVVSA